MIEVLGTVIVRALARGDSGASGLKVCSFSFLNWGVVELPAQSRKRCCVAC